MKTNLQTISGILTVFLLIFTHTGCDKDDQENFDTNIQTAQDYILCEISALDAFDIVFTSGIDSILFADGSATIDNAAVTLDMSGDTTITIDFGTIPVQSFGKKRSGIIIVTLSNLDLLQPGTVAAVTYNNYIVENIHVEAQSVVIENVTGSGNVTFNMTFNGGKLYRDGSSDENDTLNFNSNKTIEMTQGFGTPYYHDDDIFSVDGSANGSSSMGSEYTADIVSNIIIDFSCQWLFTQGIIHCTTPEYIVPAVIDFGNGNCNESLTVTLEDGDGTVYTIPALLP